MKAGDLDRRITFEQPVKAPGGVYNRPTITWEPVATVWAQVQDVLPSRAENVVDGLSMANRPARIRCRYRDDVTGDMRVQYEGRTLRIVSGPVEMGRREGLEMMAEQWSSEGSGL